MEVKKTVDKGVRETRAFKSPDYQRENCQRTHTVTLTHTRTNKSSCHSEWLVAASSNTQQEASTEPGDVFTSVEHPLCLHTHTHTQAYTHAHTQAYTHADTCTHAGLEF